MILLSGLQYSMLSQNEKVYIGMIKIASDCGTHCLFASQIDFQI